MTTTTEAKTEPHYSWDEFKNDLATEISANPVIGVVAATVLLILYFASLLVYKFGNLLKWLSNLMSKD